MRPTSSVPVLAAALVLLPAALAAQAAAAPAATRPPGCRGTTTSAAEFTIPRDNGPPVVFPSYPEIEDVKPGSPAQAAGFRIGDKIILQNGHDVIANPPPPSLAGDTVPFVVRRDGVEVPLTVVLGRWDPPQETEGVTRVCRPLAAAGGHD